MDNGKITNLMEKDSKNGKMEDSILETMKMERNQVKGNIDGLTVWFMKEFGKKEWDMDLGICKGKDRKSEDIGSKIDLYIFRVLGNLSFLLRTNEYDKFTIDMMYFKLTFKKSINSIDLLVKKHQNCY